MLGSTSVHCVVPASSVHFFTCSAERVRKPVGGDSSFAGARTGLFELEPGTYNIVYHVGWETMVSVCG